MAIIVQKVQKEEVSQIERYMARKEAMVDRNRERLSNVYDTVVLDGIKTAYGINRNGDVFSFKNNRPLCPAILQGKRKVTICYETGEKRFYQGIWVDRLVALMYIPNPNNCKYIRHKNGDLLDDSVENLEWTNEKPNGKSGYSREELASIFDEVNLHYNDHQKLLSKKLNVRIWVIIWLKMVIQHMSENNIEISSDVFLSDFETPIIDGVPNERYHINRFGVVHQIFGDRYRIGSLNPFGYTAITLVGVNHLCMMHRIVAETFIPNPDHLPEAHHKNGITCDPCVWNLQWVTHQENMSEASYLGQLHRGGDRPHKYTDEQIHHVCRLLCDKKTPMDKIADITGVSYSAIKSIRRGDSWQHISQNYRLPYVVFANGKPVYEDREKAEMINRRIQNLMERSSYGTNR